MGNKIVGNSQWFAEIFPVLWYINSLHFAIFILSFRLLSFLNFKFIGKNQVSV
jgi:hypothetical protein